MTGASTEVNSPIHLCLRLSIADASAPVGLLYAVLAGLLFVCAFLRARHSQHDFADTDRDIDQLQEDAIPTKGQEHKQVFGRPFVTAGWIVMTVTVVVAAMEIALLVLILRL